MTESGIEMIKLNDLYVTQATLRYIDNLPAMIEHVKDHGMWNVRVLKKWAKEHGCTQTNVIQITHFEDDVYFLHDGHHRAVTTWIAGRKYLHDAEYHIKDMLYSQYADINFEVGWFTPYDPRHEMRFPDVKPFKTEVRKLLEDDPDEAVEFIKKNKYKYCRPHKLMKVPELALNVEKLLF